MPGGFGANVIESPQRALQVISLKKGGGATPTLSGSCASFCTVTDNGVGDYTINFIKNPFAQTPEVFIQLKTSSGVARLGTVSNTSVQVLTFAVDGTTAAERDFDFLAIGSLGRDLY